MKNGLWWMMCVLLLLFASPYVAAEETPEAGTLPGGDFTAGMSDIEEFRLVHADSMTLTRQADKPQVLEGAVDIIMADEKGEETRIKADKITIYYKQDLKQTERIEAEGRVKITRLGSTATTELAVFRGDKNTIELLVDPHVKDSRGELSANKIIVFMKNDEVVAEGNVRGIVYPEAFKETTDK